VSRGGACWPVAHVLGVAPGPLRVRPRGDEVLVLVIIVARALYMSQRMPVQLSSLCSWFSIYLTQF
jgi:hypothetical protein